jgi:hypothetical protein
MLKEMPLYTLLPWLLIEPGAFIMERKMLLEIKERAERASMARITPRPLDPSQRLETEWTDVRVRPGSDALPIARGGVR